jgi:cytochrome c biogenesis protein CcmG/thiol:disulfide interchange protein DsbE
VLQEAWQRYRGDGVVFIGVDYHDVTSDARRFLRAHGITYPTVLDGSGKIGDQWGLSGVPETYFVDRRGRLVGDHIKGTVVDQRDALRDGIEAALGS